MSIKNILASLNETQIQTIIEIDDGKAQDILSLSSDEIQNRKATDETRQEKIAILLSQTNNLTNKQLNEITSLNIAAFIELRARCRQRLVISKINSLETSQHFKNLGQLFLPILILQARLDQELFHGHRIIKEETKTGTQFKKILNATMGVVGADDMVDYYNHLDTNGLQALATNLPLSEKALWLELMEMTERDSLNIVCQNFIDIFENGHMKYPLFSCLTILMHNKDKLIAQLNNELNDTYNANLSLLEAYIVALEKNKDQYPAKIRKEKLKTAYAAKANLIGESVKYTIDNKPFITKTNTAGKNIGRRIECFEQTMISVELALIDEYIKHQWQTIRIDPDKKKDKIQIACQAKANLTGKDISIKDIDITAQKNTKRNLNVFKRIESYENILINNKKALAKEKNSKLVTIVSRIFERITSLFIHNDSVIKPGLSEGHGKKLVKIVEKNKFIALIKNGIFAPSNSDLSPPASTDKKSVESPMSHDITTVNLMRKGTSF